MFVFNNLDHDARVHRQAESLTAAGFLVRIFAFFDPPCRGFERFPAGYEVWRMDHRSQFDRVWSEWFPRRRRELSVEGAPPLQLPPSRTPRRPCPLPPARSLPLESTPQQRGHRVFLRQVNLRWWHGARPWKPDICIAHDLDALWAAQATALSCGSALVYDNHEIWNEQHFLSDREEIVFWNQWEARLAPSVDAWVTVNRSLAEVLRRRYGVEALAVHNCPQRRKLRPKLRGCMKESFQGRPVAIFSGGFHLGRGLEEMVAAALLQKEVAIVLQGFGPLEAPLRRLAEEQRAPVHFLPKAPYRELTDLCSQADIGVMPVLPDCLNSYYCSPNKMFDYMMAGLPVVAADLPEMAALGHQCGNTVLYDAHSPNDLAEKLVDLAQSPHLSEMARSSREWAETTYNWEKECARLVDLLRQLEERRRARQLNPKIWVDPQIPLL
ncbi:MAG: glycosyltransferase [Candidatus Eremiobacteraeota bacterium]|nr:glycosyltransferase [Candidatus Eremiobacteraeota bacterium]